MPGRSTYEAWENYITPMNRALLSIGLQQGFLLKELTAGLQVNTTHAVTLNNMASIPLVLSRQAPRNSAPLYLVAGQNIEIYEKEGANAQERYHVRTLSYVYGFTTNTDTGSELEVLTFHWRRELGIDPAPRGHLHVGPALVAHQRVVRPENFHKAHIPTGRVSLEAVVRFAIEELQIKPRGKWKSRLIASERAFEESKTSD